MEPQAKSRGWRNFRNRHVQERVFIRLLTALRLGRRAQVDERCVDDGARGLVWNPEDAGGRMLEPLASLLPFALLGLEFRNAPLQGL